MAQYINKDDLVSKLSRRIQESLDAGGATRGVYLSERMKEDSYILSFIDTLEVKEVDLEKKIDIEWNKCNTVDEGMGCEFATIGIEQFYFITKYFFELGLKAQKGK